MSVTAPMMENQTTERLRELLPDMSRDLLEGLSSMVVSERKQTICKCLHFTYQLRKYIRTYESETDTACSTRALRQDRKKRIKKVVAFCKQQSSFSDRLFQSCYAITRPILDDDSTSGSDDLLMWFTNKMNCQRSIRTLVPIANSNHLLLFVTAMKSKFGECDSPLEFADIESWVKSHRQVCVCKTEIK
jgi:hypothetical protein